MRGLLLAALLSACASAAPRVQGPESLRGCWIERAADGATRTLRWFPDGAAPGSWRGDLVTYPAGGGEPAQQAFRIHATAADPFGWAVCPLDEPHGPPCKRAVFGHGHALGEGDDWMELRVAGEHLTFAYAMAEEQLTLFDGARDGCD